MGEPDKEQKEFSNEPSVNKELILEEGRLGKVLPLPNISTKIKALFDRRLEDLEISNVESEVQSLSEDMYLRIEAIHLLLCHLSEGIQEIVETCESISPEEVIRRLDIYVRVYVSSIVSFYEDLNHFFQILFELDFGSKRATDSLRIQIFNTLGFLPENKNVLPNLFWIIDNVRDPFKEIYEDFRKYRHQAGSYFLSLHGNLVCIREMAHSESANSNGINFESLKTDLSQLSQEITFCKDYLERLLPEKRVEGDEEKELVEYLSSLLRNFRRKLELDNYLQADKKGLPNVVMGINIFGEKCIVKKDLLVDIHNILKVLLNNALDALRSEGIEDPAIKLFIYIQDENDLSDQGGRIIIEVNDNGYGIQINEREEIWGSGQTTKGKGRGIGLGIVREIIEERGGEKSIHFNLKRKNFTDKQPGSIFKIELPI